MLFDLRGRGRRRAVRVIYTGLALLMGVGLVGFGIGGGFGGGGLFTAASKNEGAGGASYASEITKYKKIIVLHPADVSAWESLLKAQLHEAGNEPYETSSGVVTSQGKALYAQVARTWVGYTALNPHKVSPELAKEMLRIYDEEGLNEPAQAVRVLQLVVADEPSNASYYAAARRVRLQGPQHAHRRPRLRKGRQPGARLREDHAQERPGPGQGQPHGREQRNGHDQNERENLRRQTERQRQLHGDRTEDDLGSGRHHLDEHDEKVARREPAGAGPLG